MNALIASLESLSRDVARVNTTIEKMGAEMHTISGSIERVESQWSSKPSTPQKNVSIKCHISSQLLLTRPRS